MNKIIAWALENAMSIGIIIWFLSSLLDISGILFSVKHTDTETKVSIEKPIDKEKQKDSSFPSGQTEGPKPSW